ncbi:MAG: IPT/TIG domain-containing protein [Myxococcota bacterium]
MFVALLLGCSFGLETVVDTDRGTQGAGALSIETLDPTWGPPAGGQTVTIVGSGFAGDVTVTFGEAEVTATVVDAKTLEVVTPRVSAEGVVDVTVTTGRGSETLAEAYTYSRDRPEDSGDPDTATDTGDTDSGTDTEEPPSYAGMVSGLVTLDYSYLSCPLCFGRSMDDHATVTASAVFHAPADGSWLGWVPTTDTCVSDPARDAIASTWLDAGTSVTLSDGTRTLTLNSATGSGGISYEASALASTDWAGGVDWSLTAAGGADLPAFTWPAAFRTPDAISTINPGSITTETTSTAYSAGFPAGGSTIGWLPSGTGDFVIIEIQALAGGTTVVCRTSDAGTFTVPGSAVSGWSYGTQLIVRILRYDVSEVTLPDDSHVELVARYQIEGTGVVR